MMFYYSAVALVALIFLLTKKRYKWLYILYKTLPRDFTGGYRYFKVKTTITKWVNDGETVASVFAKLVEKHPDRVVFYFEEEAWTFAELEAFSNQVAHYFKSRNFKKGDTVGLLLENRPEYVGIWLGLSKLGVITALTNSNLVAEPLLHSITIVNCKAYIFGVDFAKTVNEIASQLTQVDLYVFTKDQPNPACPHMDFRTAIAGQPTTPPSVVEDLKPSDKIQYVYTSGTTGLPKAATISNTRYLYAPLGVRSFSAFSPDDIIYDPLPLYHTAGGMVAAGQGVVFGNTVVLRKKFSASNYWKDCRRYNCTVAMYIGEICRYLLATHKPDTVIDHCVKKIVGNGLRPQIWRHFVETFHIEQVVEFYGSTEGNCNLINIDNTEGAVGFVPRYASRIYPVILVRCDETTGKPIRDENGFCIRCGPTEPGVLIGRIVQKSTINEFTGYADKKATEKKTLKDVFQPGDLYFNTGDILVQDELGYYYFKDRTGDTFRWKGENVATNEVEAVVSNAIGLKDTIVYGVQVPGTEGRAGMVSIVDSDNTLDLNKLAQVAKAKLPSYAVPLFVRIIEKLPITGTFKLMKMDLQKDGFNYDAAKGQRLYFFDGKCGQYVPLTRELHDDIVSGRLRL